MHSRFISYLQDNRDQIIENWLTEAEIPAAGTQETDPSAMGVVPYAFFANAFDSVTRILQNEVSSQFESHNTMHINNFIGLTCDCKQHCFGGRVCMELHESGLEAFMSVFEEDWDTDHEFNQLDREHCAARINHALSGFFGREIELCKRKDFRPDCPFVAHQHLHN